jgi:S1-C subfamily serine protease
MLRYLFLLFIAACVAAPPKAPIIDYVRFVANIQVAVGAEWHPAGSAVLVECKPSGDQFEMVFVTAKHVVDGHKNLKAVFYDGLTIKIDLVVTSNSRDAARLTGKGLRTRSPCSYTTKLPDAFSDISAAGYPLGIGLIVTKGVINYPPANSNEGKYTCTACAIYGNSGGGVFDSDGNLIGITTAIAAYMGAIEGYPVTHIHLFIPLYEISDLLEKSHAR